MFNCDNSITCNANRSLFRSQNKGMCQIREGLPRSCADCKILIPLILFKLSHSIWNSTALSWIWGGGFFETFLEGSVDHILYRDYIVNRRSFIYWSLATYRCPAGATRPWNGVNILLRTWWLLLEAAVGLTGLSSPFHGASPTPVGPPRQRARFCGTKLITAPW